MRKKNMISGLARNLALRVGTIALCAGILSSAGLPGSAASAKEKDPDTALGRPMSEEEIEEQRALEPDVFPEAPEPFSVPVAQGLSAKEKSALPTKYDPRSEGLLTSVKNQGSWGTCWAHACAAAAEYSLIRKGEADVKDINLSERHLAYFMYHTPEDPLGNAVGDENTLTGQIAGIIDNYLDAGADSRQAILTLANWIGLADEKDAPYIDSQGGNKTLPAPLNENIAYKDVAHLANSYWISPDNRDGIKQELMETGAAFISLVFDDFDKNCSYYEQTEEGKPDKKYIAYYNPEVGGSGHAGLVVGWDDEFPAANFKEGRQPKENGAWLVRNSWGKEWGDEGYYWVSYEDAWTSDPSKTPFVFIDAEPADNYDHNYYYDGTCSLRAHGVSSGGSFANVYTAKGSTAGERLEAVGFAPYDTNVSYSIQIYTDITDANDPESGTPAFSTPQTGTLRYSGYCTIPLKQPVDLPAGCKFSIVITLSRPADTGKEQVVYLWSDETTSYENTNLMCSASQFLGQSFSKFPGGAWSDAVKSQDGGETTGFTFRIKGYTSDIRPVTSITMPESLEMIETEKRKLEVTVQPEEVTARMLKWSTSSASVATVDKNGTVTAVGEGTCQIKASSAESDAINAVCTVTVKARPSVIKGLKVTEATADTIELEWESQAQVAGYKLYRRLSEGKDWTEIAEIAAEKNSYVDAGLTSATGYEYVVSAYVTTAGGDEICGDRSDVLKMSTVLMPRKIENLEATVTETSVKLEWAVQAGVDGYIVGFSGGENGEQGLSDSQESEMVVLEGDETNVYLHENLLPETQYTYIVMAYTLSYKGEVITFNEDYAALTVTTGSAQSTDPKVEAQREILRGMMSAVEEENLSEADYTPESWAAYAAALRDAAALLDDVDATAESLEDAVGKLLDAVGALTLKKEPVPEPGKEEKPVLPAPTPEKPVNWSLDAEKAALFVGESLQIKISGTAEKAAWRTSDARIATVSADGKVKAKKKGKVTVSATVAGVTKNCTLQVKASVSASKAKLTLAAGKKKNVTVTLALGKKLKVKVKSKKTAACTAGKLKGKKCKLTIRGKKKGKTTITVTNKTTKEKITIDVIVK